MKNIRIIIGLLVLSLLSNANTIWEEYMINPNNSKNAKKVNSIEYTKENMIDRDIQILAKRITSLHKNSIEVAMQLLLSSKSNFNGYLAPYIRESLSTIIRDNPKLYMSALENVKAKECLAITDTSEKFVDKFDKQKKEFSLRVKALQSLPSSQLKLLCINDLNTVIYEKPYSENYLSNEEKLKTTLEEVSVSCGTDGCLISYQRIGQRETFNINIKRAYYKIEKYLQGELVEKKKIYVYAKCHQSKKYELSFGAQNDYKEIGTEWREDITSANKKIALDLCMEYVIPKFRNYIVKEVYQASNHPLVQKGFGRLYRTKLSEALKEKKPEFAGKYIIAQWGCDEGKDECTTGGVIDASTGKATEFPFKYYAHNGSKEIIYKLDSSLIIFSGDFELEDGIKEVNQVRFYEVRDGEFLFLKSKGYGK